jgi:hypothetical protein
MKPYLALLAVFLLTPALAEEALTPEKWKRSDEAIYLQLRGTPPPIPQEKFLGIDYVTAMVYSHGFVAGWDSGISGTAAVKEEPPPKIIEADARRQKFWRSGFSDGETEAKARRAKLLEQIHALPPEPTSAIAKDRAMAAQVIADLRQIESAVEQWAIESNKKSGAPVKPQDIAPYLKRDTPLYRSCANGKALDTLGNPITIQSVGRTPSFSRATFDRFSSVVASDFWRPYSVSE